mgnify:CR=1 FL=1
MDLKYSDFIKDEYGDYTLCPKVKDTILDGDEYFFEQFKKEVHNIIYGEYENDSDE